MTPDEIAELRRLIREVEIANTDPSGPGASVRRGIAQHILDMAARNALSGLLDEIERLRKALTPIVDHYRECVAAGSHATMGMILMSALLLANAEAALDGKEKP